MNKDFSYYLSKYLKEYLILERNMSKNTIRSYKKTFELLIQYLVNNKGFKIIQINFETITRDLIIDFLNYLEEEKKNTIRTRNQRLACIKSFYQYCTFEEIENIKNIKEILSIKSKKFTKKVIDYLTEEELKELLESIDTTSKKGRRDLVLLSLLYDTAARASEIIHLKVEDIHLEEKYVILDGKGSKQRVVPLMESTVQLLKVYLKENQLHTYLFENKNHLMNKDFITDVLEKYTLNISKNITPHTIRHTRAIHLLSASVPLIMIRDLLGHESVITTEEYAKVLEKDKFKAIEEVLPQENHQPLVDWNDDQDLLNQLLNL